MVGNKGRCCFRLALHTFLMMLVLFKPAQYASALGEELLSSESVGLDGSIPTFGPPNIINSLTLFETLQTVPPGQIVRREETICTERFGCRHYRITFETYSCPGAGICIRTIEIERKDGGRWFVECQGFANCLEQTLEYYLIDGVLVVEYCYDGACSQVTYHSNEGRLCSTDTNGLTTCLMVDYWTYSACVYACGGGDKCLHSCGALEDTIENLKRQFPRNLPQSTSGFAIYFD
jgi:hypothetical protein